MIKTELTDEDVGSVKREEEEEWRMDPRLSGDDANTALFEAWVAAKEYKRSFEEKRDELLEKLEQVAKRITRAEKRIAALGPEHAIIDCWWGSDVLVDLGLDIEQVRTGYGKVWCAARVELTAEDYDHDPPRRVPVLLDEGGRMLRNFGVDRVRATDGRIIELRDGLV
jgi:hypothetical protein